MYTKEFQFKDSVPTQENMRAADVSNENIDLMKEDGEQAGDVVKIVEPIAKLKGIGHSVLSDMKWVFNDNFIMIVTLDNEIAIMDSLLFAYGL